MNRNVFSTTAAFKEANLELNTNLPFSEDTSLLSDKVKINNKNAPNRFVCQAMEGCDGTADGSPDTLTKRRYERFSKGGAGIIWFEATAVLEEGRANPRQLYITNNNLDNFKKQVNDIKETAFSHGKGGKLV